jgi:predicted nucleic acid-binding protein
VILVDSTVWIDLLRGQQSAPVAMLERLLELGEAAVAPVIVQEILQGASSPKNLERLRTHLLALPMLEPRPGAVTHADAGELYARCRWAGVTPRSPHDCLIATLAVAHCVPLLHDDKDFEAIATVEPRLVLTRG